MVIQHRTQTQDRLPGRPRISSEVRARIARMSQETFLWGATRIHGELLKLGFDVSRATVSRYLPGRGYPPTQTWRTFLRNQAIATGSIGLGAAARLSDEILALVRGCIARVVRCATMGAGWHSLQACRAIIDVAPVAAIIYRSSNRTDWRDPRSGRMPVPPLPHSRPRRQLDYGRPTTFTVSLEAITCEIRLKPDGYSEAKPDSVPTRSRTSFRNEAGHRSEMKPDTRH
jgi:hypothetical protein